MKIHHELKEGRAASRRQLAAMLEVSTKTIQRDINYLRDAYNLPVEYDSPSRSYLYTRSVSDFPGFWVSEKELFALCLAHKALLQYKGTPIQAPLTSAFRKLTESLHGYLTFNIHNLDDCVSFSQAGLGNSDDAVFHQIAEALVDREGLRFQYLKLGVTVPEARTVQPWHLANIDNQWYLIAWDDDRNALRHFVLSRMSALERTGNTFVPPKDFSFERFHRGSFGPFSGDRTVAISLRFDVWAARLVSERQWHPSQQLFPQPDGSLEMHLELNNLFDIERWVLSWGAHCQVLAPDELTRSVQSSARGILAHYQ